MTLLLAAAAVCGQALDTDRLARIKTRMQQMVDKREIAGAVFLLAHDGKVVLREAVGQQDIESKKPMAMDSIFQVMSMTKPVVGAGIMMLVEDGRVVLNDPVEKYLPEFKGQQMRDDATKELRKPARPISVRDLMTHTSGMPGELRDEFRSLYTRMDRTLAESVAFFAKQPLRFEPGSRWAYSNAGIATLGRIIEVASDQPFEQYMASRIFKPLGMMDSFFFAPKEKQGRIAMVYSGRGETLHRADGTILGGDAAQFRPGAKYPAPEFGLYSTAKDYVAFVQMLANNGVHDGRRILSPASVQAMTMSHTGELKAGFLPGSGFGLTWEVTREAGGSTMLVSAGTFSHAGAFGTLAWVDKAKRLTGVLMVQKEGSDSQDMKFIAMQMASAAVIGY
jgi:CubicO group peptidase (beta-lactamase class C family)